jgi:hypothetical protein
VRIACAVIEPYAVGHADVLNIGAYPDYPGAYDVRGMVLERPTGRMGISITGVAAGLAPNSKGGWHVHRGVSCAATSSVFGHYFHQAVDPWDLVTYQANGTAALLSYASKDFSWAADFSIYGRALVVHDATSARAGCGDLPLELVDFPPRPPPSPAPEPPTPSPPTGPLPPPGPPSLIESWTLTANFSAPGSVETFNVSSFIATTSRLLSVPESAITVRVSPASVIVEVTIDFEEEQSAQAAASTLNNLSEDDYEREYGFELTPLVPPVVSANRRSVDEPARSNFVVYVGVVVVVLLIVCFCLYRRRQKKRREEAGGDIEAGTSATTSTKKAKRDKKYSQVDVSKIMMGAEGGPKPPAGPPPGPPPPGDISADLMMMESQSSFEAVPLETLEEPAAKAAPPPTPPPAAPPPKAPPAAKSKAKNKKKKQQEEEDSQQKELAAKQQRAAQIVAAARAAAEAAAHGPRVEKI